MGLDGSILKGVAVVTWVRYPIIATVRNHLKAAVLAILFQPLVDFIRERQQLCPVRNNVTQQQLKRQSHRPQQQQRQHATHALEFVLEVVDVRDYVSTDTMKLVPLGF